jgi:hypothetical protein
VHEIAHNLHNVGRVDDALNGFSIDFFHAIPSVGAREQTSTIHNKITQKQPSGKIIVMLLCNV